MCATRSTSFLYYFLLLMMFPFVFLNIFSKKTVGVVVVASVDGDDDELDDNDDNIQQKYVVGGRLVVKVFLMSTHTLTYVREKMSPFKNFFFNVAFFFKIHLLFVVVRYFCQYFKLIHIHTQLQILKYICLCICVFKQSSVQNNVAKNKNSPTIFCSFFCIFWQQFVAIHNLVWKKISKKRVIMNSTLLFFFLSVFLNQKFEGKCLYIVRLKIHTLTQNYTHSYHNNSSSGRYFYYYYFFKQEKNI